MDDVTIITNHVPRLTLDAADLTEKELKDFDYLKQPYEEQSASFIRYKGEVYDLNDLERPATDIFPDWDAYVSDSFFSGVLFKWCEDVDYVIVGRYYV